MADGKCDKCGTATTNQGNLFRTGSGMVSYQSKGKTTIQTTTVTRAQQCVLCNDCIDAYVESIRKGKTICATPINIMMITAVVGGLFSLIGGVVRVIALLAVAVCWIFAIREIIKIRKEAQEKAAEAMKCKTPAEWRRRYEVEAERAYLKQYNTMVEPVYSFIAAHPEQETRLDQPATR